MKQALSNEKRKCRRKKARIFMRAFFQEYGGERGIRTPDTLPYTHFPGVLLQPLGHLTTFFSANRAGSTGRYYREIAEKGQALFSPFVLSA